MDFEHLVLEIKVTLSIQDFCLSNLDDYRLFKIVFIIIYLRFVIKNYCIFVTLSIMFVIILVHGKAPEFDGKVQ